MKALGDDFIIRVYNWRYLLIYIILEFILLNQNSLIIINLSKVSLLVFEWIVNIISKKFGWVLHLRFIV